MVPEAFWQGVEQFNQQEFYACHDTMEALWMEAAEPEKKFYQGVLQVAVACYHLGNHNWRGAVILLGEGIRKLSKYEPVYSGIDVDGLLAESEELLIALQNTGEDKIVEFVVELEKTSAGGRPGRQLPRIVRVDY